MDYKNVFAKIDDILVDYSMPKRIKNVLAKIKTDLTKDTKNKDVAITSAIYALDEATNDVNIPMHVKTVIWDIISELESLKNV
ncbi:MAG: UPF0147 family protein [Candidatus Altiarchaeota archaeon]|nr:UPF0147 family protein [Candidatus Altiarchaeota archaeon]